MSTILARIQKFNTNRIPKMVQLKYKFMQEDPFRFLGEPAICFMKT